jgi:hypothetical protein
MQANIESLLYLPAIVESLPYLSAIIESLPYLSSRIHERTISLRFLGIILRVLRLEASVYNAYITNQFQTTFSQGGGG